MSGKVNPKNRIDPLYRRLVLLPLTLTTTIEVISAVVFMYFFPTMPFVIFWWVMIAFWLGLFAFQIYRKLVNPLSRQSYFDKWEAEGRPTSYGAIEF